MGYRFIHRICIRAIVPLFFFVVLLGSGVRGAFAKDWPQFGFDASNSRATQEVIIGNFTQAWTFVAGAAVAASPIAVAGRLYVADMGGWLHCVDVVSGATIWNKKIGVAFESTPLLAQGRVVAATKEGTVVALDPQLGETLWTAALQSTIVSALGTDGQRVFVTTGFPSGRIYALNPSSGTTVWSYNAGQVVFSSPAASGGKVYFGANNGKFTAVDAATGAFLFAYSTGGGVYRSSPSAAQGYFFAVPGNIDRKLYRIDASSGLSLGTVDLNTPAGHLAPRRPAVEGHAPSWLNGTRRSASLQGMQESAAPARESSPPEDRENPFQMDYAEKLRTGQWDEMGPPPPPRSGDGDMSRYTTPTPARAPRRAPAAAASDSNFVSSPATDGAKAYVVSGSGPQHLFAVSVATSSVLWAVDFGAPGSGGYSPTPASVGTEILAVTAGGSVRRLQPSDGGILQQIELGKSVSASPAFSNGIAVVATTDGTVYGYRTGNNPPALPPSASRSPANLSALSPAQKCGATRCQSVTLTWGDGSDALTPPSQLKYLVEVDDDADLEAQDAGYALHSVTGAVSLTLPAPVNAGSTLYWRLRVEDAHGAQSPWSIVQRFSVALLGVPAAVKDLTSVPGEEKITVGWSAGMGAAPIGYLIQLADQKVQDIGPLTSYTFPTLSPGVLYTICVTPYNEDNEQGPKVCTSAAPLARNVILPPAPASSGSTSSVGADLSLQGELPASTGVQLIRELGSGVVEGPIRVPEGGSLTGVGPEATVIHVPASAEAGVIVGARGVVANLTVSGGRAGVLVEGNAQLRNVVVTDADTGILVRPASPIRVDLALINVTVSKNRADALNLATPSSAAVLIKNSVFSNNAGHGARCIAGQIRISYSNVFGNADGMAQGCAVSGAAAGVLPGLSVSEEQAARAMGEFGLLSLDPLFTDLDAFNFKLAPGSPSIDAGDPEDDFSLEPEPNGGRINQGAFGGSPEAEPTGDGLRAADDGKGGGCGCDQIGGRIPLDFGALLPLVVFLGFLVVRRTCVISLSRVILFLLITIHDLRFTGPSSAHADQFEILFNEILADPTGNDATNERIELKNTGAFGQSLDGMCLCTASACGGTAWCFPPGTFVDAGALLTVRVNEAGTKTASDVYTGPWTDLGNAKDSLSLFLDNSDFTLDDNLVDFVEWGEAGQAREVVAESAAIWTAGQFVSAVAEGHSMEALGPTNMTSGWFDQWTPTVGSANLLNNRPQAKTGAAQSVFEGASVTLDGSGSFDPDGKAITYAWSQTSGPIVVLSGSTVKSPSFPAPEVDSQQVLSFSLTVSDGSLTSSPSLHNVTVKDTGSVAVAKTSASPVDSYERRGVSRLAMLQFSLAAGPSEDIEVTSVKITVTGTGDDARGIGAVRGARDKNANGRADEGDVEILPARTFDSDNGVITWPGVDLTLPAGSSEAWLFTVDLTNQPVFGQSFALTLPSGGIVARGRTSGKTAGVAPLPLAGPTKRISDKTSLTLTVGAAPSEPIKAVAGALDLILLPLRLSAGSIEDVLVRSLVISDQGSGQETRGIRELRLVQDTNENGALDPGETRIGNPQTYTRVSEDDNGAAQFEPLALSVPAGKTVSLMVVGDVSETVGHGEEFTVGVEAAGVRAEGAQSNAVIDVLGIPVQGPRVVADNVGQVRISALPLAPAEVELRLPGAVTVMGWKMEASKAEDVLLTTVTLRGFADLPPGVLTGVDLFEDQNGDGKLSRTDRQLATALLDLEKGEARFEGMRVLLGAGGTKRLIAAGRFGVDDAMSGGLRPLLPGIFAVLGIGAIFWMTIRRKGGARRLAVVALAPLVLGSLLATCNSSDSPGSTAPTAGVPQDVSLTLRWEGSGDIIAVGQRSQQIVPVVAEPLQGPVIRLKSS